MTTEIACTRCPWTWSPLPEEPGPGPIARLLSHCAVEHPEARMRVVGEPVWRLAEAS